MEAVADTCGGKAGALGALLRAGLPVPDGFVVPFAAYLAAVRDLDLGRFAGEPDDVDAVRQTIEARPVHAAVIDALGRALDEMGDPPVAVRSSGAREDTGQASAAGQHESFLAVQGIGAVAEAVRACWASLFSPRAVAYRAASGREDQPSDDLLMAVIVQRHLDAEISGVMFTPADPDDATRIEASWGLGPSIVEGKVTPDAYRVAEDGSVTSPGTAAEASSRPRARVGAREKTRARRPPRTTAVTSPTATPSRRTTGTPDCRRTGNGRTADGMPGARRQPSSARISSAWPRSAG